MDEYYGPGLGYYLTRIAIGAFVLLIVASFIVTFLGDLGVFSDPIVYATQGQVVEIDGAAHYCVETVQKWNPRRIVCKEWKAVAPDAVDVAEAFGDNVFGVAKGEAPLMEGDGIGVAIANTINKTVFSIAVSMETSAAVVIAGMVVIMYIVLVLASVSIKAWAPWYMLLVPLYLAFLSLASYSGMRFAVGGLHCILIPGLLGLGALHMASKVRLTVHSNLNVQTGEKSNTVLLNPGQQGGGSSGGNGGGFKNRGS